jgi:hypothetical protein
MNNVLLDAEDTIQYKVVGKDGKELTTKSSKMLAELFVNDLPDELKEGCNIIPVTDTGKQVLFG